MCNISVIIPFYKGNKYLTGLVMLLNVEILLIDLVQAIVVNVNIKKLEESILKK